MLQTFTFITLTTISTINIRKEGQIGAKNKVIIAMSISCQLAAKLWNVVFISLLAVSNKFGNPTLTLLGTVYSFLVLLILIGWATNLLLLAFVNTDLHKLVHSPCE